MDEPVLTPDIRALLEGAGIVVPADAEARLRRYVELLAEWNGFASLLSERDIGLAASVHVPDTLSLTPFVRDHAGAGGLLDIGSGGGFPAVPLAIVLPELPVVLVERSVRKVGFLRKAAGALGLNRVDIVHGEFPRAVRGLAPGVITARAVENPARLRRGLAEFIAAGSVFLCQSGLTWDEPAGMFHVEPVDDLWKTRGVRRGSLAIVRRA
jgi:16S rRNA (guanine527-N7)-methyltransferase